MSTPSKKYVVVVGGPAGCGKYTVGNLLAEKFECTFIEGDSLHPKANVEKMSHGIPLTDDDRWDWLKNIAHESAEFAEKSKTNVSVAACSALKKVYRDTIREAAPQVCFLFVMMPVEEEELLRRVAARKNHFMKADMVQSQLAILQIPRDDEAGCLVYWNNVDVDDCYAQLEKLMHE